MDLVFDSSSLIYLGKVRLLEKLDFGGKNYIPSEVYKEVVVKGFERGELEAQYIDNLIKQKLLIVKKAQTDKIPLLSLADQEVLSLAKETKSIAIIDELYASAIAETKGIESHGSIYLLLKLLDKKIFTKKEATEHLNNIISLGFYLSAEKYKDILQRIETTRQAKQ